MFKVKIALGSILLVIAPPDGHVWRESEHRAARQRERETMVCPGLFFYSDHLLKTNLLPHALPPVLPVPAHWALPLAGPTSYHTEDRA